MTEFLREKAFSDLDKDFKWPKYCPLCGRPVEKGYWTSIDKDVRYDYVCCFGGSRWAWWGRLVKMIYPRSAHYVFEDLNPRKVGSPVLYDRDTGVPL